jgi:hypothetical protein
LIFVPAESMSKLMKNRFARLRRRLGFRPGGLLVVVAMLLLVFVWHEVAVWRSSRVDRIVADLISVMGFVAIPAPDSTGGRLVVGQQTKRGWELYLVNLQTGQRTPFYEQQARAEAYDDAEFRASTWVLGWS